MSAIWEQDESEFFVLDPSGQVLDSFHQRGNAVAFAEAHDDAIYVEERQTRRRVVYSAFDEAFR